jgi:hypothetical protein
MHLQNPIASLIFSGMENPAERERKFEERITRVRTLSNAWTAARALPNHADGYWREVANKYSNLSLKYL